MAQALATAADSAAESSVASYFEVHVQRDDRWMIDCTAHNAEDALAEAEEIARKADVTAVKVINERYNAATEESAARIVFKVEKRRRSRHRDGPRLMAQPRVARPVPVSISLPAPASYDLGSSNEPEVEGNARHAHSTPDPISPWVDPTDLSRGAVSDARYAAGPWQLFAWASITLALAATMLFIVLLLLT